MLIAITGVALNHREGLRLEARYVSRHYLPSTYRANDGAEVRADIVAGDLHSGLIFGPVGARMLDVVSLFWFASLLSGLTIYFCSRGRSSATLPPPLTKEEQPPQPPREAEIYSIADRRR